MSDSPRTLLNRALRRVRDLDQAIAEMHETRNRIDLDLPRMQLELTRQRSHVNLLAAMCRRPGETLDKAIERAREAV